MLTLPKCLHVGIQLVFAHDSVIYLPLWLLTLVRSHTLACNGSTWVLRSVRSCMFGTFNASQTRNTTMKCRRRHDSHQASIIGHVFQVLLLVLLPEGIHSLRLFLPKPSSHIQQSSTSQHINAKIVALVPRPTLSSTCVPRLSTDASMSRVSLFLQFSVLSRS